ncbi:hypothetical protein DCAR_0934264 [Daucus carota subsp. sativus]|uniref:Glutaredoxin domain-containing protein n=1 Tax=Daucus carota subsp. sativus TaxID=79200 RepID=A0A175YEP7_DAUCS|nr:PREDICTED: uncharacterized protein At5g39865-like [Daucus carota subsp. sativus]WOH14742.1 hypothetical protein DCAR_0934264 [Daucus carota subsp. sativus]
MSGFRENFLKSSLFNRSLTINSSANEYSKNPSSNSSFDRSGSMRKPSNSFETVKGKVLGIRNLFESRKHSKPSETEPPDSSHKSVLSDSRVSFKDDFSISLPGDKVVVYFTSLRGIRRTFEDCYSVRMILRGFRINVDERDISMDSAYRNELEKIMGRKNVSLPQVFIKGKHIGGAEIVKQLNETGELRKYLKGLSTREPGFVCYSCGDVRFIPCVTCDGSRKIFDEDADMLKRCDECNENGLIRCPTCCD